jgi:TRAP-type C4-dicarboxylate transport system permease small subunit
LLRVLGGIAAALLFAMMALTVLDVAGRYLFAAPVPGAFELTQVLLALIIFAGLPLVSARDGHVTITLSDRWFGPRAAALRDRLVALAGGALSGVIAWRLWLLAGRLADYGDEFEFIGVPRAAIAYPMSVLAGVTALVLLAKAVRR